MRALVTAEFTADGQRRLEALGYEVVRAGWGVTGEALDREAYVRAAAGAQLLVTEIEAVDAAVLARLPDVRVVATARATPVNVDAAACAARGIPVVSTPARNAASVADFTIGLLLILVRRIGAAEHALRERGWGAGPDLPYLRFRGPELEGRTLGLVGLGAVGRQVRRRAERGFGMRVLHCDPHVAGGLALDDLLACSDVVSLHCPRGPETDGLLDRRRLGLLPRGAYLVNTAGGGIVDEEALVEALAEGRLGGAALDVFAREPLPRDSPLLTAPRLVLTPHVAGAADDVVRHASDLICDALERLAAARS